MELTITIHNDDGYVEEQLTKIQCSLISLNRKVDKMATDITRLSNVIDELASAEGAAVAELQDLAAQIGALEVGFITQEQVDALTDKASAAVEALTTETNTAKEEHPDAPIEPVPPITQPEKPVYTYTGEEAPFDETLWTSSGFTTSDETPLTLYYYSNDGPGYPGTPTGEVAGSNFIVYTGTPVVANS
jgi:hypothetical protein